MPLREVNLHGQQRLGNQCLALGGQSSVSDLRSVFRLWQSQARSDSSSKLRAIGLGMAVLESWGVLSMCSKGGELRLVKGQVRLAT